MKTKEQGGPGPCLTWRWNWPPSGRGVQGLGQERITPRAAVAARAAEPRPRNRGAASLASVRWRFGRLPLGDGAGLVPRRGLCGALGFYPQIPLSSPRLNDVSSIATCPPETSTSFGHSHRGTWSPEPCPPLRARRLQDGAGRPGVPGEAVGERTNEPFVPLLWGIKRKGFASLRRLLSSRAIAEQWGWGLRV